MQCFRFYFLLTARQDTDLRMHKLIAKRMNWAFDESCIDGIPSCHCGCSCSIKRIYGEVGSIMGCSRALSDGEQDHDSKARARLYFSLPAVLVLLLLWSYAIWLCYSLYGNKHGNRANEALGRLRVMKNPLASTGPSLNQSHYQLQRNQAVLRFRRDELIIGYRYSSRHIRTRTSRIDG